MDILNGYHHYQCLPVHCIERVVSSTRLGGRRDKDYNITSPHHEVWSDVAIGPSVFNPCVIGSVHMDGEGLKATRHSIIIESLVTYSKRGIL